MTSDTAVPVGAQDPGSTSDTASALVQVVPDATGRRHGRAPAALPPAYVDVYDVYADQVAGPGPLDADTVRAYLSRVRQFLIWLQDADISGDP